MINVGDVRSELQVPVSVISDADINYAIQKIGLEDIHLICAEVLRMVMVKLRGRVRYKIGSYTEWTDITNLRSEIRRYLESSPNVSTEFPQEMFIRGDYIFHKDGL